MKGWGGNGQLKGAVHKQARDVKEEFAIGVPWVS